MQRWWFGDEKTKVVPEPTPEPTPQGSSESVVGMREWTFQCVVNIDLLPREQLAVTGETQYLGNWLPGHCLLLHPDAEDSNVWKGSIDLPIDVDLQYRYFVCALEPQSGNVLVRRWETHLTPRSLSFGNGRTGNKDTFGYHDGVVKIDRGWLTTETIVQFKFFYNPFRLKTKKDRLIFVKVTPVNLEIDNDAQNVACLLEESLSNDTRENGAAVEQPASAFAEVVTLKYASSVLENQSQFGRPYNANDVMIFHVSVADPTNVAYLIDLYSYSSRAGPDEPPYHLGYHYVLPSHMKKSDGLLELPITCAGKHRPVGMMKFEYLKISPLRAQTLNMSHSYIRYWSQKWTGLDVGHRGSGTSFKTTEGGVIRENTIASLKKAAEHGADMVEFDVQLSKDLVPVIYHDFDVCVSLRRKKHLEPNDMLEIPMRELTLEQLKNLKVYHLMEGRSREPRFFDEDLDDHQPFPQLADALDIIDHHVGFNIEIKWSMQLFDGTMEMDRFIDKNLYLDCILDVVLPKAGNRKIVFSCFDPDICTMLRYKQNLYPVMFLTQGVTEKYPPYNDPRCNTIESAVCNSVAMELLGIVAHTEDLLRDSTQINLAIDKGLILFCWGDDNNSQETIKHLKSLGLHAIIYDKMDVLSTKDKKESIFLVEAKESQRELIQIQQLEYKRHSDHPPADDCECPPQKKILLLEDARDQIAMSTATSLESLRQQEGI